MRSDLPFTSATSAHCQICHQAANTSGTSLDTASPSSNRSVGLFTWTRSQNWRRLSAKHISLKQPAVAVPTALSWKKTFGSAGLSNIYSPCLTSRNYALAHIEVLDCERTFWEKVTLLHAENHRPDPNKLKPCRRHESGKSLR